MLLFIGRRQPFALFLFVKCGASVTSGTSEAASTNANERSAHRRESRLHAFPGIGGAVRNLVAVTAEAAIIENKRSTLSVKAVTGKENSCAIC